VLRQRAFFLGRPVDDGGLKDLAWFTPSGSEMTDADWWSSSCQSVGMYLAGDAIRTRGPRGERIVDDSFLLVLHANAADLSFCLPGSPWATSYDLVLDTADGEPAKLTGSKSTHRAGETLTIPGRSVVLLRAQR
jgi:glycogen operon protein